MPAATTRGCTAPGAGRRHAQAQLALAVVPAWLDELAGRRDHGLPGGHGAPARHRARRPCACRRRRRSSSAAGRRLRISRPTSSPERNAFATPFRRRFLPVLVPPWNRIAPDLVADIAGPGALPVFRASGAGHRPAAPDLRADQHPSRSHRLARGQAGHWACRSAGRDDSRHCVRRPASPSASSAHHLVMDAAAFADARPRCWRLVQDHPRGAARRHAARCCGRAG